MFQNIYDSLDVFVVGHFLGWIFKMLLLRNFYFAMFLSVFFEILEITFKHWILNFNECWWDSIILDVILCNTGGILIG